jgi:hypothetical protein
MNPALFLIVETLAEIGALQVVWNGHRDILNLFNDLKYNFMR